MLLETLESRQLLANIAVTSATLVDGSSNVISQAVVGERISVRVNFTTSSLAANASYRIAYTVDGVTIDFTNVTSGAGFSSGTWSWTKLGWFAESVGTHNVSVTVDADNTVGETNESDNSASFSFTAVTAAPPVKFTWPEAGVPFRDRTFNNYVDLDPTSGKRDWNGGQSTYDGHEGLDFGASNNAQMDADIPILAAAPGTVSFVQDGNYDRNYGTLGNIIPGGPPNYVVVDHGNGWRTLYYHVRRDSIQVKVGDVVNRGDRLALEGSSGNSTGSHLHFGVQHNFLDVETFLDPNTYWQSPPPYVGAARYLNDSGITNYPNSPNNHLRERSSDVETFSQAAGQTAYAWVYYTGVRANDSLQAVFKRPSGAVYGTNTATATQDYGESSWYFGSTLPTVPDAGTWTVEFKINGVLLGTKTFLVTAAGAPEARVEESNGDIVLDGRFTPFDFGSVSTGATMPTLTFKLVNHGSAPLTVSGLTAPAGFQVVDGLPASLAAGASDTFTIGLTTATAGDFAGQIRIATNDTSEAEYNFTVKGTVVGANPTLQLGISERHAPEGAHLVANVRRSGSLTSALTVNLVSDDTTEVTVPASIVIPANQSSVIFFMDAMTDAVADFKQTATITASASGYANAQNTLDVEDRPAVTLSITPGSMSENGGTATGTVTRSNTDATALTVTLVSSDTTEATVPATVTIPANQSSVTFAITAVDDTLLDGAQTVTVTASAAGYANGTANVSVQDSEQLTVSIAPGNISENAGTATGTVTRSNTDIATALTVTLVSNDTTEATVPATVTIPANQSSVTFAITAVDDNLLDGIQTVTVTASAAGYANGTGNVNVQDSEKLTVSIAPGSVSENAGAATGTVTRSNTDIATALTVTLVSNDTTEATVPATVTIPANQASVTFAIAAVDDTLLDGAQTVAITASAAGYTNGTANVNVQDSEKLTVSIAPGSISENAGTATGTVTRSNTDIATALTVTLVSNDTTEATVPATVTIPANQSSVTFVVSAVDDNLLDGAQTVTVTASAAGYANGTGNVNVQDSEKLTVSITPGSMSENAGTATGTVTRSNTDIATALTVTLVSNDTTEATVPATVTIPANQPSVTFVITAVDDTLLDGVITVTVTASAAGYTNGTASVAVQDFEKLNVSITPGSISETGTATGTVTRSNTDISAGLTVTLVSSDTTEATVPATVTIPANQPSVTFVITAIDDGVADGVQTVTITASAAGYLGGSANVSVTDLDMPPTANIIDVTPDPRNQPVGLVTIQFTENVTGVDVADFELKRDGNVVDIAAAPLAGSGSQYTLDLTAFTTTLGAYSLQLIASNSNIQDATGHALSSDATDAWQMVAPQLQLSVTPGAIRENGGTLTITVTRDDGDLSQPLTVNLQSSDPTSLTVPASVVIPANSASFDFTATLIDDSATDGTQLVTVTATAAEHTDGVRVLSIIDDESGPPLQNPSDHFDVDDNHKVDIQDAIAIIRYLRRLRSGGSLPTQGPPYLDPNGDNAVDIDDAITVIREVRRQSRPSGEGERAAAAIKAAPSAAPVADDLLALLAVDLSEAARKRSGNVSSAAVLA